MRDERPGAKTGKPEKLEQRLLVAVGLGQISEQLMHWTHRLAEALNCSWDAVYIESTRDLTEEEESQLSRTLALARSLGADVITASESDFVPCLLRIASQRGATQIVVGKQVETSYWRLLRRDKTVARLLRECGALDIHVVHFKEERADDLSLRQVQPFGSTLREYVLAVSVILVATGVLTFAAPLIGYHGIAWILLAVVVIMATFVGRGATLVAAILSATLWNFLFEPPIFSLYIEGTEDRILFGTYLIISIVLGQLIAQIRRQERAERERQERAEAIQMLTRAVTVATEFDDILARAIQQTGATFKAQVALLLPGSDGRLASHPASTFQVPEEEMVVAPWVFDHGQPAGRFTVNFPAASALYLPLAAYRDQLGVIALQLDQSFRPTIHLRNLLDAFSEQIALAIHRHQMHETAERLKVVAESERLSKTLLDSLSHEIRTPLAVIQSAAAYMVEYEKPGVTPPEKRMIGEIQEATERLNRLVGNVLNITRLESGHVKPNIQSCEVSDLIQMACDATAKDLSQHHLKVEVAPDLPPFPMDFELMTHALANLLSNAAFHTPAGTEVQLSAKLDHGDLLLTVADAGPGIPPASLPHLFEKFYRAPSARPGGTGLGLSIVKGFVEAHGGRVKAENRANGGAQMTVCLPLQQPGLGGTSADSSRPMRPPTGQPRPM